MNRNEGSHEDRLLEEAQRKGGLAPLWSYMRLSGPGWLQSAITLGGGSLASALYLGALTGFNLLWVQLLAMVLGVILLATISQVTLTTGRRPFRAIVNDVNPVLGWGWILAVLVANVVWCLPQFSLGVSALTDLLDVGDGSTASKALCAGGMLTVCVLAILLYRRGSRGHFWFESILKLLVGVVVISFIGVVITMRDSLPWSDVWAGFIPSLDLWWNPASAYQPLIDECGEGATFWRRHIVSEQRSVLIAAGAVTVGINMTFLLPYSMLRKGWGRKHRGLAIFDLSTGLLIPFVLATSCVLIASSTAFYGKPLAGLMPDAVESATDKELAAFEGLLRKRQEALPSVEVTKSDRELSAMMIRRQATHLKTALRPFTGERAASLVFGIGVLAMALSTAIVLMLISGFAWSELFDAPQVGTTHLVGCLLPAVGVLGPFVWSGAQFWLAVPTSVFGMILMPIAAWTFLAMLNSKRLLGPDRPQGMKRVLWNIAVGAAILVLTPASLYSAGRKGGWVAISLLVLFGIAAVVAQKRTSGPTHQS